MVYAPKHSEGFVDMASYTVNAVETDSASFHAQ